MILSFIRKNELLNDRTASCPSEEDREQQSPQTANDNQHPNDETIAKDEVVMTSDNASPIMAIIRDAIPPIATIDGNHPIDCETQAGGAGAKSPQ